MEKAKQFVHQKILEEIENSGDENLKNMVKAFDTREEAIKYIDFYYSKSFDNMKRISSLGFYLRKKKYHCETKRILGTKTKAMPEPVYQKLIEYVGKYWNKKIQLCLEFEGIEGPRGEDCVRVKLEDFDFKNQLVSITNRKANDRVYQVPLNNELGIELQDFISENLDEIKKHNNYVFFSSNPVQKGDHISQKYLKNVVHKALDDLDLNYVYGKDSLGRNRYIYSLHSLRGHAASRVFKKSKGDYKVAQELLDHQDLQTTMLYLEKNNVEDLKELV